MMRTLDPEVERCRILGIPGDGPHGAFSIVHPSTGRQLQIVATDGRDWAEEKLPGPPWEHVSVSHPMGVPRYAEMCWVKSLFWGPDECVVEFHVPEADHINIHNNVLHLWRCPSVPFPVPPKECV